VRERVCEWVRESECVGVCASVSNQTKIPFTLIGSRRSGNERVLLLLEWRRREEEEEGR
jgi:hypothetical protein